MYLWIYGLLGAFVFGTAKLNGVYWIEKQQDIRKKIIADYLYSLVSGGIFGQLASTITQELCHKWFKINLSIETSAGLIGLACNYWPDFVSFVQIKYKLLTKGASNG